MVYHFLLLLLISYVQVQPKFEQQVIDDQVSIGYGLAIGDVDGDKKPDILLADKKQFVWYRNGDWKRFVMIDNLTQSDNVCIAARDIDGDGLVEVAVGAQWNPGETSDTSRSGSVHYLIRPKDPTQPWTPIQLPHEPTTHRMKWVVVGKEKYHLVVVPLHGRGNKDGEGNGVRVIGYEMQGDPNNPWKLHQIDDEMHLTHNFDIVSRNGEEWIYLGGKEGIKTFAFEKGKWVSKQNNGWFVEGKSFGELRDGKLKSTSFITGIQPMHGNQLTVFSDNGEEVAVLNRDLKQGHALAAEDLLNLGNDQIVVGWREPNDEYKVGIKIFLPMNDQGTTWKDYWIDNNTMATEDLLVADLNGDGKKDIVAAGRATHNLKIYWNKNP